MSDIIWWIGAVHIAAYLLAGSGFALILSLNAWARRMKIGGLILRSYWQHLEREKSKRGGA